jgi:hypothetical protein
MMSSHSRKTRGEDRSDAMAFDEPVVAPPNPSRVDPKTLPVVEESIHATQCFPNQECNLTPGCRGRIHSLPAVSQLVTGDDGKPMRRMIQQVRCTRCQRFAAGFRIVGNAKSAQLYDRHASQQ